MVVADFEVDLIRVADLLDVIGEQRSKALLVTLQQIVVWNHNCHKAVLPRDAGHQSYTSHNERLAHPRVEVPELLVVLAQPAQGSNSYSLLKACWLEIGFVEQALHEHPICWARQLT